jgi:hypothetical protein
MMNGTDRLLLPSCSPCSRGACRSTRTAVALACLALVAGSATPARALPLLSEVFYDAVGSDEGHSFVELYGAPGTVLDGLTIQGINGTGGAVTHSLPLSGVIGPDGFFVLADVDGDGNTFVAEADALANFDFQNGPDSVVLRDELGVLDAVGYGVFGLDDVFAGEGSPAEDGAAGTSLARWFANVDTDDNALDFGVLALSTPGAGPVQVPEPTTGSLFASALAVLAFRRRRGWGCPRDRAA